MFYACSNISTEKNYKTLDIFSHLSRLKLSEITDSVVYVPLETTEESLIGSISRVVFADGIFFIQDCITNSIFLFSQDGKFITKINRQGRGPDEYLRLYDFDVDSQDSVLYCYTGNFLNLYNYSGELLGKIDIKNRGKSVSSIAVLKNCIYLYTNYNAVLQEDKSYHSLFIDKKGNCLSKVGEYDKSLKGKINYSPRLYFHTHTDTLLFFQNFCNVIYEYTDNQCLPKFNLNFGKHNVPELTIHNCDLLQKNHFGDFALLFNAVKIRSEYWFLLSLNGKRYLSIYNENRDALCTVNTKRDFVYDNTLIKPFFDFICVDGPCLVTYYAWNDHPELYEKLNLSEESNPVITLYYTKEL